MEELTALTDTLEPDYIPPATDELLAAFTQFNILLTYQLFMLAFMSALLFVIIFAIVWGRH